MEDRSVTNGSLRAPETAHHREDSHQGTGEGNIRRGETGCQRLSSLWASGRVVRRGMASPNPRATPEEIEATVDEQLARFRARMLQDLALARQTTDLHQSAMSERPVCPACGGPVEPRRPRERHLTTHQGQTLLLERSGTVCPT